MPEVSRTLFTIGHSIHEWAEFVRLLKMNGVTAISDVRSQPSSRLRHFDRAELGPALKAEGIEYVFLGEELGARRTEAACYWDGQAVYENIAQLPKFRAGLQRLIKGLGKHRIALMCAEKEPLDCHRTILICRHLRDRDISIRHILADGETEEHSTTERRLLEWTDEVRNLFEQDLTDEELLNRAYEKRGREIAYRTNEEGVLT